MKLPFNWIKAYSAIDTDIESYTRQMIMTGTAVEGYEPAAAFSNVVVGKVLSVKDHENSDHLHVCSVDVGNEVLQIVCGAPNVREDILVPVAKIGALMPDGFTIKKGKLRGVESNGMICSGPELGIPTYLYPSVGDEGILIFHEDYELGSDVSKIFGLDDYIIDYDILANRPDLLSVFGIAHESSAVLGSTFQKPKLLIRESPENIHDFLSVSVHAPQACPRYLARVIRNVRIAPSPLWLRSYLHKAGVRSINNIVDITNFVMLETGHPMHAFDLDKMRGSRIEVKFANDGDKLTTLDEKVHTLKSSDLCICDGEGATGLAGIMGGYESEIDDTTKNVAFECAVFDKTITRRTARALGIRTESSGRFEKGVSAATALYAINRACHLVNELDCGDVAKGIIDIYPEPQADKSITTSIDYIQKRTGVQISLQDAKQILERLGFTCAGVNSTLTVVAPEFRQDIEQEADICEEVLRLYGYQHIPSTALRGATTQGGINPAMAFRNKVASILHGFHYMETMHYSFIGEKLLSKLGLDRTNPRMEPIAIMNPLGEDSAYMRTSLLPQMLECAALNLNRGSEAARLYEISKVFFKQPSTQEGLPYEQPQLCLAAYGEQEDFYTLRVVCEAILLQLNIAYEIHRSGDSYYHPGRSAQLISNSEILMSIGEVHPDVLERFEIDKKIYAAEINIEALQKLAKEVTDVKELPKFPSVRRDLSVVLPEAVDLGPVLHDVKAVCSKILESASIFDIYRGIPVPEDHKSVAFAFVFRSAEKTLTDEEVQKQMEKILKTLREKYEGNIRE